MKRKRHYITCSHCAYVREDKLSSEPDWTAFECGNPRSEYYRALLNITKGGDKCDRIIWRGCPCGRTTQRGMRRIMK